jgi:hypothetical protein
MLRCVISREVVKCSGLFLSALQLSSYCRYERTGHCDSHDYYHSSSFTGDCDSGR